MDEHDRLMIIGAVFLVTLLFGMALGVFWSSFVSNVSVSHLIAG